MFSRKVQSGEIGINKSFWPYLVLLQASDPEGNTARIAMTHAEALDVMRRLAVAMGKDEVLVTGVQS